MPTATQDPAEASPVGLYNRPVLTVDPGMHTAAIRRADVDAAGQYAVTGSFDKTVRIWSVADGHLERTLRLPAGPGNVGRVDAVAISPDGNLVAAGGWTSPGPPNRLYLFDRPTGDFVASINGLPNVCIHLAFSPDGRYLAATLGGANGIRLYDRDQGWAEAARDIAYDNASYWAAFAPDGRLATTSRDGRVRLYDPSFHLVATVETGGRQPIGIAFSPDGERLAIGYYSVPAVDLLDARTLQPLPGPNTAGIDNGNLFAVAWSADGHTLFAAGQFQRPAGKHPVVAWHDSGRRELLEAGRSTVMNLEPLPEGDLLVAAQTPELARLDPDGRRRWIREPPQADFRDQRDRLTVSPDGTVVDFGYELWGGATPARFEVSKLALVLDLPADTHTAAPRQEGLPIADWSNTYQPTLDGRPLRLEPYERSRSLALAPDGGRFVLGAEWSLRAYSAAGEPLWHRDVPGAVCAVNISGDGRLVVAAYGDGTLRWHRLDDGSELLAVMPLADQQNWVAWTPEGFYAATPGAYGVLRWHVNHGWGPADSIPVSDIAELRRPAVLPLVLEELETPRALGLAVLAEARQAVQIRTKSQLPPGAHLHVLAIGVSQYNEKARQLQLAFAAADAHDLAEALVNTQGSLYAAVTPQLLLNQDANKAGILQALATLRDAMAKGTGQDLAVVQFAGHAAVVDGKLYLLPYEVDARGAVRIKATGLSAEELRSELLELAKYGRVLVLLDACHSGTATMDGTSLAVDATALRAQLAAANVTVLTSSSSTEPSREDPLWKHGAFTKVFLDALDGAADTDHNGLISVIELADYLTKYVAWITNWKQTPGTEVRFQSIVFANAR